MLDVLPIQGYMRTALGAHAPLIALIGDRIYDRVPEGAVFPYVVIGPAQAARLEASPWCCDDYEVFAQLDVWSRAVGFPEAKRIGKACGDALADRSPVIDGIQVGWFVPRDELYRTDADGLTAHGLLMFQSRCRPLGIDEPEPPDGGEENFFPDRYFASRYFSQRYFG